MYTSNTDFISPIEIETKTPVEKSIIWLHGLGADGSDFVPIINELDLPSADGIRFIFPHAPVIPVTFNNGYAMRAWFDIYELSLHAKVDEARILASVQAINQLIVNEEARGILSNQIILAGFSQGAVIALNTGIRYPKPLGGVLALSGFLPLATQVFANASLANQHLPIFVGHGTEDALVPYAFGKTTYMDLKQAGYPVDWHSYQMGHTVCGPELQDISRWLQERWKR